jgi:hypothetical protein
MVFGFIGLRGQPDLATIAHFTGPPQSSRRSAWSARAAPWWSTRLLSTATAGLGLQKGSDLPEPVSDGGSVDAPERTAPVQSSFALQHFDATATDRGVNVFIDPGPGDRRHLRQID